MEYVTQSLADGKTTVESAPVPKISRGHVLIKASCSLISAGTERMLMNFGKASIIGKIKQQPDKVKQVLYKIKTDGLFSTLDAVKSKLDQPIPMGYCHVGKVLEVGGGITEFSVGERVLSNGPHATEVNVPKNLCVRVPNNVSDEEATFGVLGAIGLQGIRLAQPTLGETVVVMGLGLIGLMTVQLLKAQGCRVLGADFDTARLKLAEGFGAESVNLSQSDVIEAGKLFSRGRGVDAVLITAATKSNDPVHQAAQMCRKRGRIVLVGVTGLELKRDDFYKKELSFQVSCSYGPGRYDPNYEQDGQDYPIGFVRWTEQRNMEAVLDMMSEGKLDVKPLITHRFEFDKAEQAYKTLDEAPEALGILLQYDQTNQQSASSLALCEKTFDQAKPCVACIGAGNYASRQLLPAFKTNDAQLTTIASSGGVSAASVGRKFGFQTVTTDVNTIFEDDNTNTVIIATRHNTHADLAIKALEAGRHVFVEKPLAITQESLNRLVEAYRASNQHLMIGFNRRFAPMVQKMKSLLEGVKAPKQMVMMVNAGYIPADHWAQDPNVGGGRLMGEACHFIDLLRFLAGNPIVDAQVMEMTGNEGPKHENVTITLKFADGSTGTVHYFANGSKKVPKERLEVFAEGRVLQLDNYRRLIGHGFKGFKKLTSLRQDKGQTDMSKAFLSAIVEGSKSPIDAEVIFEITQTCLSLTSEGKEA